MLGTLNSGKKVLCIDETWLNSLSFNRKKWRKRGMSNSYGSRDLNSRISMIAAISTEGEVMMSLNQFNTNE